MVGSFPMENTTTDLLGSPRSSMPSGNAYAASCAEPGKTVDLSGGSSGPTQRPNSGHSGGRGPSAYSNGGDGFGGSYHYTGSGIGTGMGYQGPTSIEGGSSSFSLNSLAPANIMRQLAQRPVSELVTEHGRTLLNVPRVMARAYSAAARRYLRPWSDFGRIRPGRIIENFRQASRRGEIQLHLQRNVLANARSFCPNYAFIFLAMLFMFVCTSPMLLLMLCGVGGGWSHALRNEQFRNRPWTLQIGNIQVPLGANLKMAIMSLPTLLFLHMFMGPILWSAALCSGSLSLAHAALRDRDEDRDFGGDDDDHGLGPSSVRIREVP